MAKGHFEAKKHAYRQTQDGVVVSFVIHPNDVPADLATAALGTVYMIGFATVGEPEGDGATREDARRGGTTGSATSAAAVPTSPNRPRRKFNTLPLSQQAGLRCNEFMFVEWLGADDETQAADMVRARCKVHSRAELNTSTVSGGLWRKLNADYEDWLGQQRVIEQARGHGVAA